MTGNCRKCSFAKHIFKELLKSKLTNFILFFFKYFFKLYQVVLLHLCSFLWQVPLLHRCSPWYRRCTLHVLPLLYLRPNRKMSRSDDPAVQAPHCGVDELCDYISCSQKGAAFLYTATFFICLRYKQTVGCIYMSPVASPPFSNDACLFLIGFHLHQGNILPGWGDGTAHYMAGAISVLSWCKWIRKCSPQSTC